MGIGSARERERPAARGLLPDIPRKRRPDIFLEQQGSAQQILQRAAAGDVFAAAVVVLRSSAVALEPSFPVYRASSLPSLS